MLPLLGSGFSAEKLAITTSLFMALILWIPMSACIATWRAVLNAHNTFALAAAAPLTTPLATIAFLYTGAGRWNVYTLCWGTLAGRRVLKPRFLVGACTGWESRSFPPGMAGPRRCRRSAANMSRCWPARCSALYAR
jgi:hypothetical protein